MNYIYFKIPKKLKEEKIYPHGSNTHTYISTYQCFCGCGEIVEEDVRGFNDRFITIKCSKCLEKYHSFVDVVGYEWKIYLK